MIAISSLLIGLSVSSLVSALPVELLPRTVTALDQSAFAEAQQRDDTATRAFSSSEIKTSNGQCLFINELSGDFRANLNPIQVAPCDGSTGQLWDVITSGKHDNVAGQALFVNTLTQACMNFDPRRAAGNTVIMFSCGGRADGGGAVTNSQLFAFNGTAGPLQLQPQNSPGTCLTVTSANVLDEASCNTNDPNQSFTIGNGGAAAPVAPATTPAAATTSASSSATPAATTTPAPATTTAASATTASAISVSRAGVVLNPSAAAEANPRDNTATRAFSNVAIKSSDGRCLNIDPTAGDFRQNLIPVALATCDGSAGQKFDFITAGVHNNAPNSTLVVSTLTQGCLNFDPRRAAGDTVIMFSCGGRADGGGSVTNSQLFTFTGGNGPITLAPENANGQTCLAPSGNVIDQANCNGSSDQLFTIVQ